MSTGTTLIAATFVVLTIGMAIYVIRSRRAQPPQVVTAQPEEDLEARQRRHEAIDLQGTELLRRRVELDSKRGMLGGDTQTYDSFVALEEKLRSGQIDEKEFETEKIHLLGG